MENKNTNQQQGSKRPQDDKSINLGRNQSEAQRPSEGSRDQQGANRSDRSEKGADKSSDTTRDFSGGSKGYDEAGDMDESRSAGSAEADEFGADSPVRGHTTKDAVNPQAKSEKSWQEKTH